MNALTSLIAIPVLAALVGCATAPPKPVAAIDRLAGVIGISVDGAPSAFIFVDKHGGVAGVSAGKCASQKECLDLIRDLAEAKKADIVALHSQCGKSEQEDDGTNGAL